MTNNRRDDDPPDLDPLQLRTSLPHAWLLDRFDRLEQRLLEHSRSVRADMNVGFREISAAHKEAEERARLLTDRVTIIEAEHRVEARAQIQHGAIAGVVGGGAMMFIVDALKKLLKW